MKNSNDTIWNRTRDLPACSAGDSVCAVKDTVKSIAKDTEKDNGQSTGNSEVHSEGYREGQWTGYRKQ